MEGDGRFFEVLRKKKRKGRSSPIVCDDSIEITMRVSSTVDGEARKGAAY